MNIVYFVIITIICACFYMLGFTDEKREND